MRNDQRPIQFIERREFRKRRIQSPALVKALFKLNQKAVARGKLGKAQQACRTLLDAVIAYCDAMDNIINDSRATPKRRETIARKHAEALSDALRPIHKTTFKSRLSVSASIPISDEIPAAEDLFQLTANVVPIYDPVATLYIDLCRGLDDLDDLRRIRRCSDCERIFVRTKVERKEQHFCSTRCRVSFNRKMKSKKKSRGGK